ncbi:MAG: GIY-YIG nuclease family protein [Chitinophagales bacterium]
MFTVYVLHSVRLGKTYTGYSSNFEARLKSHNERGTKGWTVKFRPWEVLLTEEYSSKQQAMAREKYLKTGRGREFIKEKIKSKNEKEDNK